MGLGSKIAREIAAAEDTDRTGREVRSRIPFDRDLWQYRESEDDFIHTKTGETRTEDQFDFDATPGGDSEVSQAESWDSDQGGDDDFGTSQVRQGRRG